MFIITTKITRKKMGIAICIIALLLCGIVWFTINAIAETNNLSALSVKNMEDNNSRIAYLESFGWLLREDPAAVEEVLIPDTLDETYAQYNALQTEQGFELSKYCGKRVKRYTYEILNYPTGQTGMQANLLIYRDKVIGGDVMCPSLDGFMHGLSMPE